jgi:predicted PurR-regulated permease PerM
VKTQFTISRQNIFVVAFFVLLIGLLSLLFSLLEPFLRSFVWATILVMVFYPFYDRLLKLTGNRTSLAALIATLLVSGLLILPGFFIVDRAAKEVPGVYTYLSATRWDEKSAWLIYEFNRLDIGGWLRNLGIDLSQSNEVLQKEIAQVLQNLSQFTLEKVTFIFKNLALFALQAVFILIALFFFFRDGSRLALKLVELLPMETHHREEVVQTLSLTVTAVVRAIFIIAVVQGFMSAIGFAATGVPAPILLGLLAFIFSFIPILGAASVWIPACLWLFFMQDQTAAALGLLAWGLVITLMDHVLRPLLIGRSAKLPLFWLFFATIGGLKVYGFLGIFLGPIILSLVMAFLAIYKDVYLKSRATASSKRKL